MNTTRILYTIGLLIGAPLAFIVAVVAMVRLDDFFMQRFGKPPVWATAIGALCWLFLLIRLAWEEAGKWLK